MLGTVIVCFIIAGSVRKGQSSLCVKAVPEDIICHIGEIACDCDWSIKVIKEHKLPAISLICLCNQWLNSDR